jgi:hypothetical protein
LARSGIPDTVVDTFAKLGLVQTSARNTLADLFDAGLAEIARNYRCEYVYKAAIADRIVYGKHSPRTSSLAVELGVGNSIVDAAVFNGTSTAYEIKTEFDTPARLTTQTPAYLRAFDRVNVVTHPDCGISYVEALDPRIGVMVLKKDGSLSTLRPASGDVARIEPSVVFRMLRRPEYMSVVQCHFGDQPDLPNGLIESHYRRLFETLSSAQAHEALISAMRARTTDESSVAYLNSLPRSLRALGYAAPLSSPQRARVLMSLATSL